MEKIEKVEAAMDTHCQTTQRREYKVFGGALAAAKVSRARALVLEPRKTNGCSAVLLHVGSCPKIALLALVEKQDKRG